MKYRRIGEEELTFREKHTNIQKPSTTVLGDVAADVISALF
jgi:hypothetical protein